MSDMDNGKINKFDNSYYSAITKKHDFIHNPEKNVRAVAVSIQGRGHVLSNPPIPCQDFCGVSIYDDVFVFSVADGHSSCKNSEFGAEFAVASITELIGQYKAKKFSDIDLIRLFRTKKAYEDLLDIWFKKILQKENITTQEKNFQKKERLIIAYPYGTTLLTAIVCPSVIICFAIGDGGFYLLKRNPNALTNIMDLCNFDSVGDIVSTSLCDLNPRVFLTLTYDRQSYNGILLMSDGVEKPWLETGLFERLSHSRYFCTGNSIDKTILDFMLTEAHPVQSDDISLILGDF